MWSGTDSESKKYAAVAALYLPETDAEPPKANSLGNRQREQSMSCICATDADKWASRSSSEESRFCCTPREGMVRMHGLLIHQLTQSIE